MYVCEDSVKLSHWVLASMPYQLALLVCLKFPSCDAAVLRLLDTTAYC